MSELAYVLMRDTTTTTLEIVPAFSGADIAGHREVVSDVFVIEPDSKYLATYHRDYWWPGATLDELIDQVHVRVTDAWSTNKSADSTTLTDALNEALRLGGYKLR